MGGMQSLCYVCLLRAGNQCHRVMCYTMTSALWDEVVEGCGESGGGVSKKKRFEWSKKQFIEVIMGF